MVRPKVLPSDPLSFGRLKPASNRRIKPATNQPAFFFAASPYALSLRDLRQRRMRHTTHHGGGRNAPIAGWFIAPTDNPPRTEHELDELAGVTPTIQPCRCG